MLYVLLLMFLLLRSCPCYSHQAEPKLNEKQQAEFKEFVAIANATFAFPNRIMQEEHYLLKFFTASNFKKDAAKTFLENTLQWREKMHIEFNQLDLYSEFVKEYNIHLSTRDHEGRPIMFSTMGRFDHSKVANSEVKAKYLDYVYSKFEKASNLAIQEAVAGRNISRWIFLMDVYGFDAMRGACLACVEMYGEVASNVQKWPLMIDTIVFLNTPELFKPVLEVIKENLEPEFRNAVVVVGNDPVALKTFLLQIMDEKDIPDDLHIAKDQQQAMSEQLQIPGQMSRGIGI